DDYRGPTAPTPPQVAAPPAPPLRVSWGNGYTTMEQSLNFRLAGIGRTFIIHGLTRLHTCGYYSTSASDPSSDRTWCVPMVCRIKHFRSCTYAICRPYKRFIGMVRPFISGWINLYLQDHVHSG